MASSTLRSGWSAPWAWSASAIKVRSRARLVLPPSLPRATDCYSHRSPVPVGKKANIRANKPVPERRTQLHAVADDPLTAFWTSQNATMRDDPTRPATVLSYLRIRRL